MLHSFKFFSTGTTPRAYARLGTWLRANLLLAAAIAAASHGTVTAQSVPALWSAATSTVIVGPAAGPGQVRALNWAGRSEIASIFPFDAAFAGGTTLAAGGDVDGDEIPDVVVAMGPGGGFVRVHSGADAHTILSGFPYGPAFTGGVSVALGDIDGDGRADVIVAPRQGGSTVRAFSGADFHEIANAAAPFGASYVGGVHVAAGDVDGDGRAEVVAGQATGGLVSVLSSSDLSVIASAYPFGAAFTGGVSVAAGDVTGDGLQEVVVAQAAGGSMLRLYDVANRIELSAFAAVPFPLPGGLRVAAADLTGDGRAEIIASAGPGGPPYVAVWNGDGLGLLDAFPVYGAEFAGGVTVAAAGGRSLRFESGNQATFTVGVAGSFTVMTTGAPAGVTIAAAGGLPPGITFTDRGDGTATLAGTATGAGGEFPLTFTARHGARTASQAFVLRILPVNEPPSFTAGANQTIAEDAGPQTVSGWATNISPGPSYESGQTVTFTVVSNTNPALFASLPTVSADGTLTYAAASNALGTATIALQVQDNGGVANGGDDTSAPQSVTFTVTPINDAPSFTPGGNHTSLEDAGAQSVPNWATGLSTGPADEVGQTLTFAVTSNTNPGLFSVPPAVSSAGTLSYTAAPDANGSATLTLVVRDDGGTGDGGVDTSTPQSVTLTVTPVNDAPGFTATAHTSLEDAGAQNVANVITGISAGAADEASQALTFEVVNNTNPQLFIVQPAVSPTGALTYTAVPEANGTATLTLVLRDDGDTNHGGDDTSAPQNVTITVTAVNDAPSFTGGGNHESREDTGTRNIPNWATAISTGTAYETAQTLTFVVTGNSNPSLFLVGPAVSSTGALTYRAAPNANGVANITIVAMDDGGTADGGVNTSAPYAFAITVVDDVQAALEKTLTTSPANLDMPEAYRLRLSLLNTSTTSLASVGPVVDTLPPGTVFNGATPAADCQPGCVGTTPATVTWTSPCAVPLAPGSQCDIVVNVTFASSTFPSGTSVTNSFTATVVPVGEVPLPLGPASVTHLVTNFIPAPAATIDARLAPDVPSLPTLNEVFSYDLNVVNTGNVPLDNLVVIDTLPVELQVDSVTTGVYAGLGDFAAGVGVRVSYEKNTAPGVFTLWGASPNTTTNTTLTAPPPGLGAGEYITRVRWEYGQVSTGMTASARPRITGRIINPDNAGGPVAIGDTIQNCAAFSAVHPGGPTNVSGNDCVEFVVFPSFVANQR